MNRKLFRIIGGVCFVIAGVLNIISINNDQPMALYVPPILVLLMGLGLFSGLRKMVAIVGCILGVLYISVAVINGFYLRDLFFGVSFAILSVFLFMPEKRRVYGALGCITYLFGAFFISIVNANHYGYKLSFSLYNMIIPLLTVIGIACASLAFSKEKKKAAEGSRKPLQG